MGDYCGGFLLSMVVPITICADPVVSYSQPNQARQGREIRRLITKTLPSVIVLLIFLPWRNVFFVL
jgi:hypothetical protein